MPSGRSSALYRGIAEDRAAILEKVDNTWVISFQAILVTSSYEQDEVSEDTGEEATDPEAN